MNPSACKYSYPGYWAWTLQKKDVWNSLFAPPDELDHPIFVNTWVAGGTRGFLDNNWACYPDVKALLGFVQYVYLPAAFYYVTHKENRELMIPICSTEALLTRLWESGSRHSAAMCSFVRQLRAVWNETEEEQPKALARFCAGFNRYWARQDCRLGIQLFFGVDAVADEVKNCIWCEELFAEETGFSYRQFDELCARFAGEDFAKHLLLHLLHTRIGCLSAV